jgi:hypothetical protein
MGVGFCDHNHERKTPLAGFVGMYNFAKEVYGTVKSPIWSLLDGQTIIPQRRRVIDACGRRPRVEVAFGRGACDLPRMARADRRLPGNAPGPWFVDDSCMDCDASRQCAPSLLEVRDGRSVFVRQPTTDEEKRAAGRALLICPTASIGVEGDKPDLRGLFPQEIAEGIHLVGYASARAYGSNAWFLERASGNVLVDGPRWVPSVAAGRAERRRHARGLARSGATHGRRRPGAARNPLVRLAVSSDGSAVTRSRLET